MPRVDARAGPRRSALDLARNEPLTGIDWDTDPPWSQPAPARSVLLVGAARSGSQLLSRELWRRGVGRPLEYFNPVYTRYLSSPTRWTCFSTAEYLASLIANRTTASGLFAAKALGEQFFALNLDFGSVEVTSDDLDRQRAARLHSVLGPTRYVHLRRRDVVRQAVSYWLATVTDAWMQLTETDHRDLDSIGYDFAAIAGYRHLVLADTEQWKRYFAVNEIRPYVVWYEDLADDVDRVVGEVVDAVTDGLPPEAGPTPVGGVPGRLHRQLNPVVDRLVCRFRDDLASLPR